MGSLGLTVFRAYRGFSVNFGIHTTPETATCCQHRREVAVRTFRKAAQKENILAPPNL